MFKLEIRSWEGCGGIHSYGRLIPLFGNINDYVDVEHPLTQKEATYLNKRGRTTLYKKGSSSIAFWTREELIEYAIEEGKKQKAKVITLGDSLNPGLVIYSNIPEGKELNSLGEQAEAWYDVTDDPWRKFGEDVVEKVWNRWQEILEKYK